MLFWIQNVPIKSINIIINGFSMHQNGFGKNLRIFFNGFSFEKILSICKAKIAVFYLPEIKRFSHGFVDNRSKWLFNIANERFSLIKTAMIKSFINIESIQQQKCFQKMKQKSIAHIEQKVIFVNFGARISAHPIHFAIIFMEKIFCRVSFDAK